MARVQADPITAALAHPTRRNLYSTLCETEEMSTVQLQSSVDVDRYNLYHHLKKLASLNLVENHRDAGRSRWWKRKAHIELPEILTSIPSPSQPASNSENKSTVPPQLVEMVSGESEVHIIQLEGSRDQVGAKRMLELLATEHGIELNLPWNFLPSSIALIAKKK